MNPYLGTATAQPEQKHNPIVEEPPYPYVQTGLLPSLGMKKFDGSDINVTVRIDSTIHNFKDVDNLAMDPLCKERRRRKLKSLIPMPESRWRRELLPYHTEKCFDGGSIYTEFLTKARINFKDGTYLEAPEAVPPCI